MRLKRTNTDKFNDNIITQYKKTENTVSFNIDNIKDTNYFFIDIIGNRQSLTQSVKISDGISEYTTDLNQDAKLTEGIIIVFVKRK